MLVPLRLVILHSPPIQEVVPLSQGFNKMKNIEVKFAVTPTRLSPGVQKWAALPVTGQWLQVTLPSREMPSPSSLPTA